MDVSVVYGTGHASQNVGPTTLLVRLLYVCTAQFPHALVGVVENVPAAQTVWEEEPAGQEFPLAHAAPAVKPAVAQKVPTAHGKPVAEVLPVPTQ